MREEQEKRAYWKSLQRSLTDRSDALMEYTDTLLADSSRSDDGFARALKMCRLYTRVFVEVLDDDIGNAGDEQECREFAEGHLEDFTERYARIDRWLSRGSQSAVPRALQTICRRQFDAARLTQYEPVLTVGAPDSFEVARTPNLHELLFGKLKARSERHKEEVAELEEGRSLAIISVPYLEGTRTLWYPITVGHELCHLRLAESSAGIELADLTTRWLDHSTEEYAAARAEFGEAWSDEKVSGTLLAMLRRWAVEVVCDVNAVRMFGPAGVTAITEFISIADSAWEEASASSTHPPSSLRLEIMLRCLERLGFSRDEINRQIGAWSGAPVTVTHDPVATLLIKSLIEAAGELIEFTLAWGFKLESSDEFEEIVGHCVEDLLDGVPCDTHVRLESSGWTQISTAHVVNAAWQAREKLATDDKRPTRRTLQRAEHLPPGERRLHLDRLAGKAIDSIELSRLWQDHSEVVSPGDLTQLEPLLPDPTIEDDGKDRAGGSPAGGGVLSSLEIVSRLRRDTSDLRRLLVAPLFSDAVQEAGVDLRLGPDFIVFRHSATAAFDPLARAQDPRMVQERVTKSWGEQFVLHPNELVLAATLEYLLIPSDLSAQVITRSSYGRLGLMTATAVQIQPGSRGCVTLELQNQGETPISLWPGARVAQLVLWSVINPPLPKPAKYWFPTGPEFSKAHDDDEASELGELGNRAHARLSEVKEPLECRFVGPSRLCDYFGESAKGVGVADIDLPKNGADREGDGDVSCSFRADARVVARVLQRWGAAQELGISVGRPAGESSLTIRCSKALDEGMVKFDLADNHGVGDAYVESKDFEEVHKTLKSFVIHPDLLRAAEMPV